MTSAPDGVEPGSLIPASEQRKEREVGYLEDRANLAGKVAVVIGGAAGVGAAVTLALAHAGVDLVFCDIRADAVESMRRDATQLTGRVTGLVTDAYDPDQLAAFYDAFDDEFDQLDVVVNVAGFTKRGAFADATLEDWTEDLHRNLGWVMQSMSLAIPRIRAGGCGGSIVNFTTIEATRGAAGYAAYAGAKAGLTNFSRAVAVELGSEGIRVNLVAPDTTPTESMKDAAARALGGDPEELRAKAFAAYVPMGAPPPREHLADAVLFLASDLSASITGTTLHVDGGTWASSGFIHWPDDERPWGPTPSPWLFRD